MAHSKTGDTFVPLTPKKAAPWHQSQEGSRADSQENQERQRASAGADRTSSGVCQSAAAGLQTTSKRASLQTVNMIRLAWQGHALVTDKASPCAAAELRARLKFSNRLRPGRAQKQTSRCRMGYNGQKIQVRMYFTPKKIRRPTALISQH